MTAQQIYKRAPSRRIFVKPVGSFVPKLAQKAFEKYGFSAVTLITDWAVIAGPELSRYTQPERLKWPRKVAAGALINDEDKGRPGANLVLRVDPSRALEVQYALDQLIERINGYFGYHAVAAIRILQAQVNPPINARSDKSGDAKKLKNNLVRKHLSGWIKHPKRPCDEGLSQALERLQATFQANSYTAGTS